MDILESGFNLFLSNSQGLRVANILVAHAPKNLRSLVRRSDFYISVAEISLSAPYSCLQSFTLFVMKFNQKVLLYAPELCAGAPK